MRGLEHVTPPRPLTPPPDLARWIDASGSVILRTGNSAVDAVREMPADVVAIDIETPSVTDSFTIKCVTAAWWSDREGCVIGALLDPMRDPPHADAVRAICARASTLVLHNAAFDVPGLVYAGLLGLDQIAKIVDTIVLARSAFPDVVDRKGLDALKVRYFGGSDGSAALRAARAAGGYRSMERWFRDADIHIPAYRDGAMMDTVYTLRVAHPLYEDAVRRQLDHPFGTYGCATREDAAALVMREQEVNRITLRRAARGYAVDSDYLDRYAAMVEDDQRDADRALRGYGVRPGVGADVVAYLDEEGALPTRWPRTPTGRLSADKRAMERLPDHPIVAAHLRWSHVRKVTGYLSKVRDRASKTGLLHPQWQVLGASATGRMSVSEPELQQFPDEARPIITSLDGGGFASVDWSSIEPALMGWMAQDWEFIDPFEEGADIYAPVQRAARLDPGNAGRKIAKVVVLAGMYGQGTATLARNLGMSEDGAVNLQRGMRRAMPKATALMHQIKSVAAQYGLALTVSGRVLPIPRDRDGRVMDYKAVNYTAQGSCADLLYETVIAAEREGLGDHVHLLMHDEVVCSPEVAVDIARIMATPPAALIARAGGRVPRIRTDIADLGASWRAC